MKGSHTRPYIECYGHIPIWLPLTIGIIPYRLGTLLFSNYQFAQDYKKSGRYWMDQPIRRFLSVLIIRGNIRTWQQSNSFTVFALVLAKIVLYTRHRYLGHIFLHSATVRLGTAGIRKYIIWQTKQNKHLWIDRDLAQSEDMFH